MSLAPTRSMKKRLFLVVFLAMILIAFYICTKLFDTAIVNNEQFSALANNQQQRSLAITAKRGTIYDRNYNVLVESTATWDVIISPHDINEFDQDNRDFICKSIASVTGVDYKKLVDACTNTDNYYYVVKKHVDKTVVDKINDFIEKNSISPISIILNESSERVYPNGALASNVLGFVNEEEDGYGLELYYNDYLKGVDGRIVTVRDNKGNAMPYEYETKFAAKDGNSVITTIDETLQYYLEKNLEIVVSQHSVENRSCGIIMNCKTGAIVAMATNPSYDPNMPSYLYFEKDREKIAKLADDKATEEQITALQDELREQQWKNKAVGELYIPGSVFKIVTCASALEEEVVGLDSTFSCAGEVDVAGTKIKCWSAGGHGTSDLTEAMIRSCNPAFIAIGQRLGDARFCKYFEAFGLTEKTGIDLPGEAQSLYVPYDRMGIVELSSSAFGQTNKLTPIQMITAISAAVNGGKLLQPYIVDKIIDPDGNIIKATEPTVKRQVISEETSAKMRTILESVVTNNGGNNAYIDGYRIAGKSGTSEKIDDFNSGKHETLRYVGTFSAFVPADDPEYAMLVVVDEPTGGYIYGSIVAAPVVSAVFKEGLEYLGIYPQYTAEQLANQDVSVPYLGMYTSTQAEMYLHAAGLEANIVGSTQDTTVAGQIPLAGELMPRGSTVVVYMSDVDFSNYRKSTVPNVTGLTIAEANKALSDVGLNMKITGAYSSSDAKAVRQSVGAGLSIWSGSVVEVEFLINNETG